MATVTEAEIVRRKRLNEEEFALDLRCPEVALTSAPGQFVMLRASQAVDPLVPRPLSVFALLREGGEGGGGGEGGEPWGITLVIKCLGLGTRAICERAEGERLPLTGPLGRGLELDPARRYLMVAGGTGIAPVAFAAQELAQAGGKSKILYGGSSKERVHLSELGRAGLQAVAVTEDGSLGRRGLVTDALAQELDGAEAGTVCFACGPWEMMRRCAALCAERDVEYVCSLERYMACGIGVCLSCVYREKSGDGYRRCCREGPVVDGREVDWDD